MASSLSDRLRLVGVVRLGQGDGRTVGESSWARVKFADPTGAIANWISGFDGRQPLSEQLLRGRQSTTLPTETLAKLVEHLVDHDVLVATHMAAAAAHRLGYNPQCDLPAMTTAEISKMIDLRSIRGNVSRRPARTGLEILGRHRQSTRDFGPREITLKRLSEVLAVAYSGVNRATPSAGALYPCTISAMVRKRGTWGLHRWDATAERFHADSAFTALTGGVVPELAHALDSATYLGRAPVIVTIAMEPSASCAKYGNRGYRFALLEAGHIAQMILLSAAEAGLSSLEWGAFRDRSLHTLLNLPASSEIATVVALGHQRVVQPSDRSPQRRLRRWQEDTDSAPDLTAMREIRINEQPTGLIISQTASQPTLPSSHGVSEPIRSTGVGWATETAYVRAIAEALERRVSGRQRVDLVGTVDDILSFGARPALELLPPPKSPAFAECRDFVPLSPDNLLEWVVGVDDKDSRVAIPVEMVFYPVKLNRPRVGQANSSGVAAGTGFGSAFEAALNELVERDAFVRTWLAKIPPPRWEEPPRWFARAIRWGKAEQITAHWFPSAARPTVGVAIRSPCRPSLAFGMATREDYELALEKALQEATASYFSLLSNQPLRSPSEPCSPKDHAQLYTDPTRRKDVDWFFEGPVARLRRPTTQSLDRVRRSVMVFDLSAPDDPLKVVRAMSPNLLPIWFGKRWQPVADRARVPHFFA